MIKWTAKAGAAEVAKAKIKITQWPAMVGAAEAAREGGAGAPLLQVSLGCVAFIWQSRDAGIIHAHFCTLNLPMINFPKPHQQHRRSVIEVFNAHSWLKEPANSTIRLLNKLQAPIYLLYKTPVNIFKAVVALG